MSNTTTPTARIDIRRDADGSVRVSYDIPVLTKEKSGRWFATCPLLKSLGSSSKSKEDAIKDHWEDVDTFFAVHLKHKTLDRALRNFGWRTTDQIGFEINPQIPVELFSTIHTEQRSLEHAAAA